MTRYFVSVVVAAALGTGYVLWSRPAFPHAQTTTTVQFDREIVHVLDNHCVMCHAEKGLAFPLTTYEQAYASRWQMRMEALDRHMAPWAAVPGYGDFANSNALTQREIDFVVSWAESFGPRNNGEVSTGVADTPTAPPAVQAHFDSGRWVLGKPDLLLPMSANTIEAQRAGEIKSTLIDPKLTADRWLRGLEYKPGDRRVVHAVSFAIRETGQWIGSWSPWQGFVSLPPGLAVKLPAGSHIVAEIRYYGCKEPVVERGSVGLYFAERPSLRRVSSLVLDAKAAAPASAVTRKLSATTQLEGDLNILSLEPLIRPGLESVEVTAKGPDGATQVLLFAQDIPLDWPTPYVFSRPVSLRKGTELSVIEHYARETSAPIAATPVTFSVYAGAALVSEQPKVQQTPAVQRFELSGTVKSVDAEAGRLLVQHGDIPGLMGAMTMSYRVGKQVDLKKIAPGDQIQSDVVVSDTGTFLENIQVIRRAK